MRFQRLMSGTHVVPRTTVISTGVGFLCTVLENRRKRIFFRDQAIIRGPSQWRDTTGVETWVKPNEVIRICLGLKDGQECGLVCEQLVRVQC